MCTSGRFCTANVTAGTNAKAHDSESRDILSHNLPSATSACATFYTLLLVYTLLVVVLSA